MAAEIGGENVAFEPNHLETCVIPLLRVIWPPGFQFWHCFCVMTSFWPQKIRWLPSDGCRNRGENVAFEPDHTETCVIPLLRVIWPPGFQFWHYFCVMISFWCTKLKMAAIWLTKKILRVFLSKIFPVVKITFVFPNFLAYAIPKVYNNLNSYGEVKVIQGHPWGHWILHNDSQWL